jgi:hypothetical protein
MHIYWFSVTSTHVSHSSYLLIFSAEHPCNTVGYMGACDWKSVDMHCELYGCSALKINRYGIRILRLSCWLVSYILIFSHKHPCIPQFISIDFSGKHPCIPRCIFIDFKCRALMYPMVYIYWFSMPSTHVSQGAYLLILSAEHSCIPWYISIDFKCRELMYPMVYIYWFSMPSTRVSPWDTWVLGI